MSTTEPSTVSSVCRICVAQCGLRVTVDDGRIVDVRGDDEHPASRGYTCSKGRSLADFHHNPDRLDRPRLGGTDVDWDTCLDDLGARVSEIVATDGIHAVGIYSSMGAAFESAGLATERRLVAALGITQRYSALMLDCGPLLRAAQLVAGTAWEMNPTWVPEHDEPSVAVLVGNNPVVSHGYQTNLPDALARIRDFRLRGGELWVIDPRRTETADLADHHLAIRPGADAAVLAWLARELLHDGADEQELRRYCSADDVASLGQALDPFDLTTTARVTGLPADELTGLLGAVRRSGRIALLTGTGVQFAPDALVTEWLRWVVSIITGSVDHPGGMWVPPGGLVPFETRRRWRHAPADGSDEPGPASRPDLRKLLGEHPAVALVDEIEAGNLRALFVAGGSPLTAAPDPERMRRALARLDVLAVTDVTENELTLMATHVLAVPAMFERTDIVRNKAHTCWAPAILPVGADRRPSWWVWAELGRRLGVDVLDGVPADRCSDESLNRVLLGRARGGDEAVIAAGPHGVHDPELWGWVHEHALPDGRWRLAPAVLVSRLPEVLARLDRPDHHLTLVARRVRRAHNAVRYIRSGEEDREPPLLLIHASDADDLGVTDGARVVVRSASGELAASAHLDERVPPGSVSLTHGWGSPNVATLVDHDVDPLTGQPVFTAIPVEVEVAHDTRAT